MSEVQRFWSHEASNIRCVREADFDRVQAVNLELQARLTVQDQRVDDFKGLLEYMLKEDDMPVHWFAQRIEAALNPTAEAASHDQ